MRIAIGVAALVAVACGHSPTQDSRSIRAPTTQADLDEVFQLAVGESATLTGTDVTVTFRAVVNDRRCPHTVQCFTAGSALIQLELDGGGATTTLGFSDGATVWIDQVPWSQVAFAPGYVVEFRALTPYPETPDVPVPQADYRAAIVVSALPVLAGIPVAVTRLGNFCCSTLDTAGLFVVRDQTAWRAMWERVYRAIQPLPPLPSVDFTQSMLVVVALGSRPTTGYDGTVAAAARDDGILRVQALERYPGAGCVEAEMLTNPIDIVTLPATGTVDLSVVRRAHACEGDALP
jgi:hypothetical protein